MLKKVRVCDKCGKAEANEVEMVKVSSRFSKSKQVVGTIRQDLCPGCYEQLAISPGFRSAKAPAQV